METRVKLKLIPEDFVVEEVLRPPLFDPEGAFQLFQVDKRGVAALDALTLAAKALGVPAHDVAFAGLKDLRSESSQMASAFAPGRRFPAPILAARGLTLTPIGRSGRAVKGEDIERNRFRIVVRDLAPGAAEGAAARVPAALRDGLPNYFDDQRFGGASPERGFVAEAWSKGDLRRALELLIARPSPKDPRQERLEKEAVRAQWGRWGDLVKVVKGEAAPLVRALANAPHDVAGAFRALEPRFRALLVSQYQSYLWNEEARSLLRAALPREALFDVMYRCGSFALVRSDAHERHAEALRALQESPLPYAPVPIPREIGVEAKGGARALFLRPDLCALEGEADDELRPGRRKVLLRIEIPRSAYATLVAKRLFYEPPVRAPHDKAPAAP